MAQIEAQDLLRLAERSGQLVFFDLEATGLNGDYNSIILASVKPWMKANKMFYADRPGDDASLVKKLIEELSQYQVWVTYYGKEYDMKMVRTRALNAGLGIDLPKKHHLDMYYLIRYQLNTSRRSQGHILSWLYRSEKEEGKTTRKMTVSARTWNDILTQGIWTPEGQLTDAADRLSRRCKSDTEGLQSLYRPTKYLVKEVTR